MEGGFRGGGGGKGGMDFWSWSEVGLKVVIFLRLGFSKLGCGLSIGFGYFSSVDRELD